MTEGGAGIALTLNGEHMLACPSGAAFIPSHSALVVADLHLGKAERNARRGGGLWPPYEGEETLARLEGDRAAYRPDTIIALGDSFDDGHAAQALDETVRKRIESLAETVRLIWIAGNHDPRPHGLPGECVEELSLGPLILRHIAQADTEIGELSGHYHPKLSLQIKGRRITRKCFLADERRIILPAYGAYTGGMRPDEPPLAGLMSKNAEAILTGKPMARLALHAQIQPASAAR